jgi:hypothetical protein
MVTLRIQHNVPDFDSWKNAFDSDPAGRVRSGVRRYQVSRQVDDPNYVMIDLEFDTAEAAEGLLATMRQIWAGPGGRVSSNQQARIVETLETRDLT